MGNWNFIPGPDHLPHILADRELLNPFPINVQSTFRTASLLVYNFTTDTGTAILYLDGLAALPTLPDSEGWVFDGLVLALSRESSPQAYGWTVYGVIRRQTGAANTAIYGVTVTAIGGDLTAPTAPAFAADTTNGALQITASGVAGKTLDYACQLDLLQI